jgi:hypothetical protein
LCRGSLARRKNPIDVARSETGGFLNDTDEGRRAAATRAALWHATAAEQIRQQARPVDGLWFDSMREGRRYQQLRLEERAGHIRDLQMQVPFNITSTNTHNGERVVVAKYLADFTYWRVQSDGDALFIVEDAKGVRTDVFNLKKKLIEHEHGIEILLT